MVIFESLQRHDILLGFTVPQMLYSSPNSPSLKVGARTMAPQVKSLPMTPIQISASPVPVYHIEQGGPSVRDDRYRQQEDRHTTQRRRDNRRLD